MATDVKLEDWADKSEAQEAAVSVWFKKPGATVKQGDLLAELIVEKVNLEVLAPGDGILLEICAKIGEAVSPASVLARIGSAEEWAALDTSRQTVSVPTAPATAPATAPVAVAAPEVAVPISEVVASPVAKRLMKEHNISLAEVAAFTNYSVRRIGEEEVQRYLVSRQAETAPAAREVASAIPYSGLRRMIGDRMSRSLHETAQVTLTSEADVTELVAAREAMRADGATIGYTALVARAVARALPQHPRLHAALEGDTIRLHNQLNLGIAVDTSQGLLVPVIRNAGELSCQDLTTEIARVSQLAREGKLAVEDNTGGTFTITNLGSYGIDIFTPILNSPQVAILGIGRIAQRPGVADGQVVPRQMLWLSLTFDHRIVDGGPAAAFLHEVREKLEHPEALF
ncbi:MAG TPA: dihydrolipoamide acetyltransferase family protein [Chloroflexia bacterium]|nr:dihydrolipoamide acetyltransferase family protein [Chloroflexia bacterium]